MSDSFQADGAVVQLIANHQKDMMHYVYSLTLNWSDAEDVIQETNVRLWEQRDDYDSTKPFLPWARTIAYYLVLAQRTKKRRERIYFSEEVMNLLAEEMEAIGEKLDGRHEALQTCLEQLSDSNRQMIDLCYFGGLKINAIAEKVKKSVEATYKMVARIRHKLHACVESNLKENLT